MQNASCAGAEIEQLERAAVQAPPRDRRERRLDQALGIGAGVERMRIDEECAAVELAGPE